MENSTGRQVSRRSLLKGVTAFGLLAPAGVGALSLSLSACSSDGGDQASGESGSPGEMAKQIYTTPYGFIPGFADAFVADRQGYWREFGLDMTVHGGQGTSSGLQLVTTENSQYSIGDGGKDIITITKQDLQVKQILQVYKGSSWLMLSLPDNPITEPSMFPGKKIGVASNGGVSDFMVELMSKNSGIDLADYEVVVAGIGAAPYELARNGQIDAWLAPATDVGVFAEEKLDVVTLNPRDYIYYPSDCYVVSNDLIENQRDTVVAFAAGILKAGRFLSDEKNWDAAIEDIQSYAPETDADSARIAIAAMQDIWFADGVDQFGIFNTEEWVGCQEQFVEHGYLEAIQPVERFIDTSIVEDALKML